MHLISILLSGDDHELRVD